MKKLLLSISLGGAVMLFTGCGAMNPLSGALYTDATGPITATSSSSATKEGTATCKNILGLIALGDCSVDAAAKQGSISQIKSVDTKVWSILGLYTTSTTIVKGD